ncbi:hypothetical protein Bca101_057130 [Brassica carinata]
MKLYLWDQAAFDFCKKFRSSENTPSIILVTTVYPKRLGGTLALTSMASSRMFLDYDVQPTKEYIGCNPDIAKQVNADVVTKTETLTIGEIFSYMKHEAAKDAFFVFTATIDDVVQDSPWYLAKISVYDKNDEAVFVLLGDAGLVFLHTLAYSADKNITHFRAMEIKKMVLRTRVITVTKVLSPSAPPYIPEPVAYPIIGSANEILATGDDASEPFKIPQACADVGLKRMGDGVEKGNPKRFKDGN